MVIEQMEITLVFFFLLQNQYELQVPYRFWDKDKVNHHFWMYFSIVHTESGIVVYQCLLLVHCWEVLKAMNKNRKEKEGFPPSLGMRRLCRNKIEMCKIKSFPEKQMSGRSTEQYCEI